MFPHLILIFTYQEAFKKVYYLIPETTMTGTFLAVRVQSETSRPRPKLLVIAFTALGNGGYSAMQFRLPSTLRTKSQTQCSQSSFEADPSMRQFNINLRSIGVGVGHIRHPSGGAGERLTPSQFRSSRDSKIISLAIWYVSQKR